jgi:4-amino-4-deoxy-L-arabinose transferase-like glycosyltransferase
LKNLKYVIPILLFVGPYILLSYNLEGQPWQGDEVIYLGGSVYFNLLKNGDLFNSCWNDTQHCTLIQVLGYGINNSPVRNFFVGLGKFIITGNDKGDFYDWSCYWWDCHTSLSIPPHDALVAGRFFSPILGSFSVVVAYYIGKLLFNRLTGLIFSLAFLFDPFFFWNSRVIMTEVYTAFFILLTILLLLYSMKETKMKMKYFIAGAIVFGLTINTKEIAISIIIPIAAIILLKVPSATKLISLKDKHHLKKSILLSAFFILVSTATVVTTNPGYYKDVTYPLKSMQYLMTHTHQAPDLNSFTYPSLKNDNIFRVFATFHTVIMPYFFNYHPSPDTDLPGLSLTWNNPGTFSTIPISLFFIVGLFYILNKKSNENMSSRIFLLVWLVSSFIFSVLIINAYINERYFLPLFLIVMLISSYGLARFVGGIDKKIQIPFVALTVLNNMIAVFVFWKLIYFSPSFYWTNPLTPITMQAAFTHLIVIIPALLFVAAFLIITCHKIIIKNETTHTEQINERLNSHIE